MNVWWAEIIEAYKIIIDIDDRVHYDQNKGEERWDGETFVSKFTKFWKWNSVELHFSKHNWIENGTPELRYDGAYTWQRILQFWGAKIQILFRRE